MRNQLILLPHWDKVPSPRDGVLQWWNALLISAFLTVPTRLGEPSGAIGHARRGYAIGTIAKPINIQSTEQGKLSMHSKTVERRLQRKPCTLDPQHAELCREGRYTGLAGRPTVADCS